MYSLTSKSCNFPCRIGLVDVCKSIKDIPLRCWACEPYTSGDPESNGGELSDTDQLIEGMNCNKGMGQPPG